MTSGEIHYRSPYLFNINWSFKAIFQLLASNLEVNYA